MRERGLQLAPHGKTTMAPELWARQLDAGAWGITVANLAQLAVARSFGVERVMVANMLLSPLGLRWLAGELAASAAASTSWSGRTPSRPCAIMEEALADVDAASGRSTCSSSSVARGPNRRPRRTRPRWQVARAVAASDALRLAGVAGYEGALAHDSDSASLADGLGVPANGWSRCTGHWRASSSTTTTTCPW